MKKRSTLSRQLIAWNTLTLAALLAILGLATHFASYGYALNSVDSELATRVRPPRRPGPGRPQEEPGPDRQGPFGGPTPGQPGPPGPDDLDGEPPRPGEPIGDPFGFEPGRPPGQGADEQRPRVYSVDGEPLQRWNTSKPWDSNALCKASVADPLFTNVSRDGEPYRVATLLLPPGPDPNRPRPVVQAAYPLADLNRATSALDRGLLALLPLGALGAWAGATFLTRRVLGRVRKFAKAADRMGEDDLSRRLPVEGNDEFADLAATMNSLLARLEDAFRRQAAALDQQRRFTADASHELKTPLTVIKGSSSLALAGSAIDDRSRSAFNEINHAADGMVKLVQDLLYLARADAGSLGSDRQEILAMEVLERAKSSVAHLDGGPIEFAAVDTDATIWGSEQELVRLFTNVLSNARLYTSSSGRVTVATATERGLTKIVVTDNGCGIAAEQLSRLGQRFFRADASRSRDVGGTGLGLAIVAEIVRAHSGTIQFESELGIGTRVTITLPRVLQSDDVPR